MARIEFYSGGKLHRLSAQFASRLSSQRPKKGTRRAPMSMTASAAPMVMRAIQDQAARLGPLFHSVNETSTFISIPKQGESAVIPTATIVLEGAKKSALKKLKSEFGVEVIDEGREGKLLLRAPEGGEEGIRQAAHAAKTAYEEMGVTTAHPNFVRVMQKMKPSAATTKTLWNLQNNGNPGIPDADVAAYAAWTITKGDASVRVAVLDEGVDTGHPALAHAVEGDFDFVDGNPTSMPDGDDAHGTACAGIIFSNDSDVPGIAPNCKLVAVRIAKGDGNNGWVFDDFKTADAIDAAWKEGEAAVLSNSWCGGPPVDIITRAFERARTRGRGGKGSVIAVAAGNSNNAVGYPATLPDVLAVGASNQWDQRKSPSSKDGETWWGSCYGRELDLLAPGVKISTTDIQGTSGYDTSNFVHTFNGTSSATPHVAAAAALILSIRPDLTEQQVREVITSSTDWLKSKGKWDKYFGWGRLNIYSALRRARRL